MRELVELVRFKVVALAAAIVVIYSVVRFARYLKMRRLLRKPSNAMLMEQRERHYEHVCNSIDGIEQKIEDALSSVGDRIDRFIASTETKLCLVWGTAVVDMDHYVPNLSPIEKKLLEEGEKGLEGCGASPLSEVLLATLKEAEAKEERRSELKKTERVANLAAAPTLMTIGKHAQVQINVQMPLKKIVLRVEEPFVIEDVLFGKISVMANCDSLSAAREVTIAETVHVGHLITVRVRWPHPIER
jgi:hypothetical protein